MTEVNNGSSYGLVPDGTKPLPEPMLTCHLWGPMTITWEQFHSEYPRHYSAEWISKSNFWNYCFISHGQSVKLALARHQWCVNFQLGHWTGNYHWLVEILWSWNSLTAFIEFKTCVACLSSILSSKICFRPVDLNWPLAHMASGLTSFWHRLHAGANDLSILHSG